MYDVMESMTHREYKIRIAWLERELDYDNPSRSDYYLMQIAQEVRRVLSKKPDRILLKHFKLKSEKTQQTKPVSKEKIAKKSKSFWFGLLGVKDEV